MSQQMIDDAQKLTKVRNVIYENHLSKELKTTMSATLHADLRDHLHAGTLDHPLVIIDEFADRFVPLANRMYLDKRDELGRAEQAGDWAKYIWLHERPYRASALWDVAEHLLPEQYWRLVREVWLDADQEADLRQWSMIWASNRPYREQVMTPAERDAYARLPRMVRIHRGADQQPVTNGLVWTVSRTDLGTFLGTAIVPRENIRAFFARGRKVIVLPRDCVNLRIKVRKTAEAA